MKPETKHLDTRENLSELGSGKDVSDTTMKVPHTEENIANLFFIRI